MFRSPSLFKKHTAMSHPPAKARKQPKENDERKRLMLEAQASLRSTASTVSLKSLAAANASMPMPGAIGVCPPSSSGAAASATAVRNLTDRFLTNVQASKNQRIDMLIRRESVSSRAAVASAQLRGCDGHSQTMSQSCMSYEGAMVEELHIAELDGRPPLAAQQGDVEPPSPVDVGSAAMVRSESSTSFEALQELIGLKRSRTVVDASSPAEVTLSAEGVEGAGRFVAKEGIDGAEEEHLRQLKKKHEMRRLRMNISLLTPLPTSDASMGGDLSCVSVASSVANAAGAASPTTSSCITIGGGSQALGASGASSSHPPPSSASAAAMAQQTNGQAHVTAPHGHSRFIARHAMGASSVAGLLSRVASASDAEKIRKNNSVEQAAGRNMVIFDPIKKSS